MNRFDGEHVAELGQTSGNVGTTSCRFATPAHPPSRRIPTWPVAVWIYACLAWPTQ